MRGETKNKNKQMYYYVTIKDDAIHVGNHLTSQADILSGCKGTLTEVTNGGGDVVVRAAAVGAERVYAVLRPWGAIEHFGLVPV